MSISVEIMMEEHKNILRMLAVMRKACYGVLKGEEINYEDFYQMIDFVKSYADDHHHGKEEKFLFKEMTNHLGRIGDNLISRGMLVEHDYGRLYMQELREALERVKAGDEESKLDVIANAVSYTHLLARHIKKEDELVYQYGVNHLAENILKEVDEKSEAFELMASEVGTQKKYIKLLESMEAKYMK